MAENLFQNGQKVGWVREEDTPADTLGSGPFTVEKVLPGVEKGGHPQRIVLSKEIDVLGDGASKFVYDSYKKQWVLPENMSHFGQVHQTTVSGDWLTPVDQS